MARRLPDGSKVGGESEGVARALPCARERSSCGESSTTGEESSFLTLIWDRDKPTTTSSSTTTTTRVKSDASAALKSWAGSAPRRQTKSAVSQQKVDDELTAMLASGMWDSARPVHLVALYCLLHEKVYGVEALDLRGSLNRQAAARMVLTMLQRDFDSCPCSLVDFMKWSWQREEQREEWRRRNNTGRRRLSWRIQFGGELLVEYLMQRAQNG